MSSIRQWVTHSVPVAQPRARHRTVRSGSSSFTQTYTPSRHPVNAFKAALVSDYVHAFGNQPPLDGPVHVHLRFLFPRPSSMIWKTKPMERVPHEKKPDLDNLAKSVLDALNGIVWRDDAQVASLSMSKQIAAGDECPGVLIRVGRL